MTIQRHDIDIASVSEAFFEDCEYFPESLDIKGNPNALVFLASDALRLIRRGSVASPSSPFVPRGIKIAAQALTGIFTAKAARGPTVSFILDNATVTVSTQVDESIVEPSKWIQAFWLSFLCNDSSIADALCAVPPTLLRASSTFNPEYVHLMVEALQSFYRGDPATPGRIVRAMEATDPTRNDIRASDWVLQLEVPQIQLLFYHIAGDPQFPVAFEEALESHRRYWTATPERARHPDGFVSFGLSALALMAHYAEVPFDTSSEYLLKAANA